jgi:G patch domain and KOW motifs-containing protein
MSTSFSLVKGRKRIIEDNIKTDGDKFEVITNFDAKADRQAEIEEVEIIIPLPGRSDEDGNNSMDQKPLLVASQDPKVRSAKDEGSKFRMDMSLRAEDVELKEENYRRVPIDQFGAAMLRGMGWKGLTEEDKAHAKELEQLAPREPMLGLGAKPRPGGKNENKKVKEKNDTSDNKKNDTNHNSYRLSEGDIVLLEHGDHDYVGKRARVEATRGVPGLDRIRVSLEHTSELLELPKKNVVKIESRLLGKQQFHVGEMGKKKHAPQTQTFHGMPDGKRNNSNSKDHYEDIETETGMKYERKRARYEEKEKKKSKLKDKSKDKKEKELNERWCMTGIRVRIVSRKYGTSRDNLKAVVIDVFPHGTVSLRMDSSEVLDGVKQKHLETCLPSEGGRVKVVKGIHRGRLAKVLEIIRESEMVALQLDENEVYDADIVYLSMDAAAEFTG